MKALHYSLGVLCLTFIFSRSLDGQNITGVVTSADDAINLPGVNILVKGTDQGAVTDFNGSYNITAGPTDTLIFSYIGFKTEEIPVENRSIIDVALRSESETLDEVVIVAYGQVKKSDLTGSVSSVSDEELTKTAPTSLDQALQGRAAGVQVTQVSGRPGGETSIRIRGSSSINAGNEPLYVIDGMLITSDNNQTNSGAAAGSSLNGLSSINPADIESIEILKDASSTAMYGSRGANGVVLITTKRGKKGTSSINYNAYVGIQDVVRKLDLLDGEDFANYMNAYSKETGLPIDPRYIIPENFGQGTDWQEAIFRRAITHNNTLSIVGGDDKTNYNISGGYYAQEGIIINSDFNRLSFRSNLDRTVNDKVKIGSSVSLSQINSKGVLTGAQSPGTGVLLPGVITSAILFPPTLPVYDESVPGGYIFEDDRGRNIGNPVADALETDNGSKNSRVIANVYGTFEIVPNLTFKASGGVDAFSVKENRYVPNFLKRTESNNGEAVVATVDGNTWLTEFTLNYSNTFGDKHYIDALVGNTYQQFNSERLFAFTLDFASNRTGWHNLGVGENPQPPANGELTWGIVSYLGRVNYTFDNKLLLTLTGRVDGSSKFGANNKYGFFPSGSIAYKLHQEEFIQDLGIFYSLKTRLSYGLIGNQEIAPYASLSTIGPIGQGVFNNTESYQGQEPLRYPNADLAWEKTSQLDFGIDAEFMEGRIGLTFDIYHKATTDLLLVTPLPATSGFSGYFSNIGGMNNRGLEVAMLSRNLTKDFTWNTNLNFSINRNEITELSNEEDIPVQGVLQVPAGWSILREGESIGTFFGYQSDGIFQNQQEIESSATLKSQNAQPGDRKYKDIDGRDSEGNLTGQPDGVIDEADRTIIGNANPDFTFGLTNDFSYLGFDLSFFIQGVFGNDIVNANLFEIASLNAETNVLRENFENRWTPENPSNGFPRINPAERNIFSDAQVEDGSFVRLKNFTLGYTLPQNILNRIKISSIRIYASANNLYTLTKYSGYDPEVNAFGQNSLLQGIDYGGYPLSRSILGGIQISF